MEIEALTAPHQPQAMTASPSVGSSGHRAVRGRPNAVPSFNARRRNHQARLHRPSGNLFALGPRVASSPARSLAPHARRTGADRRIRLVSQRLPILYGGHRAAAELFGVAPATIDGLVRDLATAPIDGKLRPLFAFVKKLTVTPTHMTQADADA